MTSHKHKAPRCGTRYRYKKHARSRGMPNVNTLLQEFSEGDMVHIKVDSGVHAGLPYRRFDGKTGKVVRRQGDCYVVKVKDMRADKETIVHPAHLKPGVVRA